MKLYEPSELYTQTSVVGPPDVSGPRGTMTRLACVVCAAMLRFDDPGGEFGHEPVPLEGVRVKKVPWLPFTAVKLSTTPSAVPSDGTVGGDPPMPAGTPVTFTLN